MKKYLILFASLLGLSSFSHATLNDLGNGQVEDTVQNIIWMQDANLIKTSCDANDALWQAFDPVALPLAEQSGRSKADICADVGRLNWYEAEVWVGILNSQNYLGHNNWRQPIVPDALDATCSEVNSTGNRCVGSELGHLYHAPAPAGLGNPNTLDDFCGLTCLSNTSPFSNAQPIAVWTGSTYTPNTSNAAAWTFHFGGGWQGNSNKKINYLTVWPVRPVAAPALPQVSITANDSVAMEEGMDIGQFIVTRTGSTAADLTVNFAISGDAINGTDYIALPATEVIPAGDTFITIIVIPNDDALIEGTEVVIIDIANGGAVYDVGIPSSAGVSILDNDALPVVTITANDSVAMEEGMDIGSFIVARTGATTTDLTVNLTVSGSATNGTDYTAIPAIATILSGETSIRINVVPVDDVLIEGIELVFIDIANGGAVYDVGTPGRAGVSIADNDALPVVTIIANDATASEAGLNNGQFTLSCTAGSVASVNVAFTVAGSATNGTDYTAIVSPVTVSCPGTQVIDVAVLDDGVAAEPAESVSITLLADASYGLGVARSAVVTIMADAVVNAAAPQSVPTLGTWALILMSLLLMFIAMPMVRRRFP